MDERQSKRKTRLVEASSPRRGSTSEFRTEQAQSNICQSKSTMDSILTDRIDATSTRMHWSVPIFNALWFGTVTMWTGGPECLILT